MKQNLYKGSCILLLTFLCAIACKKSAEPSNSDTSGVITHDSTQVTTQVPPRFLILLTRFRNVILRQTMEILLFIPNPPLMVIIMLIRKTIRASREHIYHGR